MNAIEYANARAAIKSYRAETQARLDAVASAARVHHADALRKAATAGETHENEARYLVAMAAADGLAIAEGYPTYSVPDELRALLREAKDSGIISWNSDARGVPLGGLIFHGDFSGLKNDLAERGADCAAYNEASEYRAANKNY